MLDFVFRHMSQKSVFSNISTYEELEDFYFRNGDEYFLNITMKHKLTEHGCDVCNEGCIENDVLDELLERKLWKKFNEDRKNVMFTDLELEDISNIKDYENKLKEKFKLLHFDAEKLKKLKEILEVENIFIQENYSENIGLKGMSKSKMVLIDKENENKTRNDWNEINDEMRFLSKTNVFIKRIYVRKGFNNAQEFVDTAKKIEQEMSKLDLN